MNKQLSLVKKIFGIIALLTVILVALGGYVRGTGAGLACPDWPLCFGRIVPPDFGSGVLQEWVHRVVAKTVGVLTIVAAVVAWRSRREFPRVWSFSLFMLALVIVQGVFGGLTVLMTLQPWVVTTHLALGTLFFQLVALVALERAPKPELDYNETSTRRVKGIAVALSLLVFLQMVLGGFVGSSGASLVCPKLPMCSGLTVEPGLLGPRLTVLAHFVLGLSVLVLVFFLLKNVRRSGGAAGKRKGHVFGITFMVGCQVLLGIGMVHAHLPVAMAVSHLILAQLILLALLTLARDLSPTARIFVPEGASRRESTLASATA